MKREQPNTESVLTFVNKFLVSAKGHHTQACNLVCYMYIARKRTGLEVKVTSHYYNTIIVQSFLCESQSSYQ